jgi:MoaA/NifB/PqqE/SkfB family radical SAM enzyme
MANFMGVEFADFPPIMHLEGSVVCSGNCIFCPTKRIGQEKLRPFFMSEKIWTTVIDQCVGQKVERMSPFLNGDPFDAWSTTKRIVDYCKKRSPKTVISLYTNAGQMERYRALDALESGVSYFHFSLGGITRATGRKVQPGVRWQCALANVIDFMEEVHRFPSVKYAVCLAMTKDNAHELEDFKKFWRAQGAYDVEGNAVTNRDQEAFIQGKYDTDRSRKSSAPCMSMMFNHFYVLTNGDVVFCCEDALGKVVVGNVMQESVKDIWLGDQMNGVRRLHLEKRKSEIKGLCDGCIVVH